MKQRLLKNRNGETLVETLAAILIFTMASIALYTMVTTATRLNQAAREMDLEIEDQLLIAEGIQPDASATGTGTVKVTVNHATGSEEFKVEVYGGTEDDQGNKTLYSYFKKP